MTDELEKLRRLWKTKIRFVHGKPDPQYYVVGWRSLAAVLGVSVNTARRYARDEGLPYEANPSGHHVFWLKDLRDWAFDRGREVDGI